MGDGTDVPLPGRKSILVFIDWYLPGFRAGGPIQSVASMTARLPYNFWIITSTHDHQEKEPYPGIPTGQWIRRGPNEHVMYLSPGGLTAKVLDSVLQSQRFDHLYINSIFSREFAIRPLRYLLRKGFTHRIIVAPRGMLKAGALSVKSVKKLAFLHFARITGLFDSVTWHATNPQEAVEIRQHFPNASQIYIAANLPRATDAAPAEHTKIRGQLRLISVARVSKEKNIANGIRYLGALPAHVNASWDIFGPEPDLAYRTLCEDEAGRVAARIRFMGPVPPTEISSLLVPYDFFYLPTLGENYGHAIAEALLAGVPVIVSDKTPWKCLEKAGAGWGVPLREEAFAEVLTRCADMEGEEYAEHRRNAWLLGRKIANDAQTILAYERLFG